MYIPEHFHEKDLERLDWLAAHDAFATLISVVDAVPFATHLPVLYRREAQRVTLMGHWARANPQWQSIEAQRVLVILHGPHAYVSPRWYVEPTQNVPTWNYAVAHIYGQVRLVEETEQLAGIVTRLADNTRVARSRRGVLPIRTAGHYCAASWGSSSGRMRFNSNSN